MEKVIEEILEEIDDKGETEVIAVFHRGRQIGYQKRTKAMNDLLWHGKVMLKNITISTNYYNNQTIKIFTLGRFD